MINENRPLFCYWFAIGCALFDSKNIIAYSCQRIVRGIQLKKTHKPCSDCTALTCDNDLLSKNLNHHGKYVTTLGVERHV